MWIKNSYSSKSVYIRTKLTIPFHILVDIQWFHSLQNARKQRILRLENILSNFFLSLLSELSLEKHSEFPQKWPSRAIALHVWRINSARARTEHSFPLGHVDRRRLSRGSMNTPPWKRNSELAAVKQCCTAALSYAVWKRNGAMINPPEKTTSIAIASASALAPVQRAISAATILPTLQSLSQYSLLQHHLAC